MTDERRKDFSSKPEVSESLYREIDKVIREVLKRAPQQPREDRPRRRQSAVPSAAEDQLCQGFNC